jgi:hypothetical protein
MIPVIIFVISFGVTYGAERFYDRHHMLDQIDTMFDADATDYLVGFGSGWMGPSFRHPFVGMLFSIPIRTVSQSMNKLTGLDDFRTRRELGLLITPLSQGVKNVILYLLLLGVGVTVRRALILCGLSLFALSTLTIGSVPESFAISSATLVAFAWFMTRDFRSQDSPPLWQWVAAGCFGVGVTLTNVIPLAVFHFLGRKQGLAKSWWDSVRETALVCALSLALALSVGAALSLAFHYSPAYLLPFGNRGDLGFWLRKQRPAEELAVAAVSTFAGVIPPGVGPNQHLVRKSIEKGFDESNKPTLMVMFTYAQRRLNNWLSVTWAILFAALLLTGLRYAYRRGPAWSSLALASAALLIFNFTLHRFFYLYDMFLYAPHWQVPMIFSLSGLTLIKSEMNWGTVALVALALLSAVSGYQFISLVSATLSGPHPAL